MFTQILTKLPVPNPQVEELLRVVGTKGFIGGGMARFVTMSHVFDVPEPRDIDIFPTSDEPWDEILEPLGYTKGNPLFNCVDYTHPDYSYHVQLVNPHSNEYITMWGSINHVLANFDFTINQVGLQALDHGYLLVRGERTLGDLDSKTLHISHMNNPVAMAARVIKFSKLGYSISMSELAKLFIAWGERPEEYRNEITALVLNDSRNAEQSTHLYQLLRTT